MSEVIQIMAARFFMWYNSAFMKRPILTQIATAGILTTSGDVIAQSIERRSTEGLRYSFKRTAIMSCFGFCYFGPIVSGWLMLLRKLKLPAIINILVDQGFMGPCLLGGFLTLRPILSGHSLQYSLNNVKTHYFSYLKRSYSVWIPVQTANFLFVPINFRMLFSQFVAFFWMMYLSYSTNPENK